MLCTTKDSFAWVPLATSTCPSYALGAISANSEVTDRGHDVMFAQGHSLAEPVAYVVARVHTFKVFTNLTRFPIFNVLRGPIVQFYHF